jgi:ankyrin repeat protein
MNLKHKLTTGFDFDENKDIDQLHQNGSALSGFWCYTPLIYAAVCGDLVLTKELVENGAILDKIDDFFNSTALMWASKYGHDKL